MTDNELLLAISEMMDSKLKSELQPLKNDLQTVKDELEIVKRDVKHLKKEEIKCRLWTMLYLMKSKEYMAF